MKRFMTITLVAVLAVVFAVSASAAANGMMKSTKFEGPKANTGTVTFEKKDGKRMLTLSGDFKVPDTPDPHWQLVDSKGNVYLVQKLKIKDDKVNTSIEVPAFVKDVAKVQIWCAWAEVNLGEASFSTPAK